MQNTIPLSCFYVIAAFDVAVIALMLVQWTRLRKLNSIKTLGLGSIAGLAILGFLYGQRDALGCNQTLLTSACLLGFICLVPFTLGCAKQLKYSEVWVTLIVVGSFLTWILIPLKPALP